jgi:ribosomal protein S6--L-glutamate ligase
MGVTVPLTISTSDPAAVRSLPAPGRGWIVKGMSGGYSHTEAVDGPVGDETARRLADLGCVMLQERIEGDNVRAFVIGGRVIGAAEIIPTAGSEIDSRRGDTRMRALELPVAVQEFAVATARRWGMAFAAVDFMREAGTERFVVLECNSAPFFVTFESRTGLDVSGPLANHLLVDRK